MMEKRNVATDRRRVDDGDDVERASGLFDEGLPKKASSRTDSSSDDERYDEDTGTGDRRKR